MRDPRLVNNADKTDIGLDLEIAERDTFKFKTYENINK